MSSPWQVLPNQTEIVAIHAALLATSPKGDIVYFGDWAGITSASAPPTPCRLFRMETETVGHFAAGVTPTTNAFCGGQAFLSRGWLLVAGGTVRRPPEDAEDPHALHWDGERACWIYRPDGKAWVRAHDLNFQPGSASTGGGRWYPTLVALKNGEVFAAGGHPSDSDRYPKPIAGGPRHNNNTPERYSLATDRWTLITSALTAPHGLETDSYPRFRLLPSGLLFSQTAGIGSKRIFDAVGGAWAGPDVDDSALPAGYARGSDTTSVLLPLMPPGFRARVLACNSPHDTSFLIDLVRGAFKWEAKPDRQGSAAGKKRHHACAVLLPTGQVFVSGGGSGGMLGGGPFVPVLEPEIYTPEIDWSAGRFTGPGSWATIEKPASVPRGYHSVALLLPDGRVWTAGGTENGPAGEYIAETRVELFSPWYVGASRPRILRLAIGKKRRRPAGVVKEGIDYGEEFSIDVAGDIARVALMRCGSVTHAYDSDQRYVALAFTKKPGTLTVTAPRDGALAPPGYYMLWIVDAAGVPCERATFVHLPKLSRLHKLPRHWRLPPKKAPVWKHPRKPARPKRPGHPKRPRPGAGRKRPRK